jgi:hypothetical protein
MVNHLPKRAHMLIFVGARGGGGGPRQCPVE